MSRGGPGGSERSAGPGAGDEPVPAAPPVWAELPGAVLRALGVSPERGLDPGEVERRRARFGPNQLRQRERRRVLHVLIDQLRSLLVGLLVAASAVAFAFGEDLEGVAIAVVVVLNVTIGFVTELRAVRSLEALRRLGQARATVRRGARAAARPASELVPGDVVLLEGGDVVTADLRLVEASKLEVDQSALTGESVPVGKGTEPVAPDTPVAERRSMLFKGTSVTRGSAVAVVVGTGMRTELGRITALVEEARPEVTPLERRLEALGRRLVVLTLFVAAGTAGIGIASGRDVFLMVETGIALAVAAVPEGLPVVATLALARGMWRMARRHALVERLSAVETLGTTGIILTDKTGTLTENHMRVVALQLDPGVEPVEPGIEPGVGVGVAAALRVGVLCNNASLARGQRQAVGDPTEAALLEAGAAAGMLRDELLAEAPEVREEAFDPELQLMATFHETPCGEGREGSDGLEVAVKGSPEAVLAHCTRVRTREGPRDLDDDARRAWHEAAEAMAARGLRVLGLATRRAASAEEPPYRGLELLALVALLDPPREHAREALERCAAAGIRVVMVTGDHPATARTVAEAVGMVGADGPVQAVDARDLGRGWRGDPETRERLARADVVARASPELKLELLALHQQRGSVVAMTGDGVNDAPALRKADIGIAMGRRGTQVAREASAMVLQDDELSTLAVAVEQGRVIFGNIRKFAVYLLSCNLSEVLAVAVAAAAQAPLPLLPLQVLFLNLVTDVFPALALGFGEGERGLMQRPPRPAQEPILRQRDWAAIGAYGVLLTAAVLASFAVAHAEGMTDGEAVTVSFLTLASAQLWHVFDMRGAGAGRLRNDVTRNPWVWGALVVCVGLLLVALLVPPLAHVLDLHPLGRTGWLLVGGFGLLPMLLVQLVPGRLLPPSSSSPSSSSSVRRA